MSLDYGGAKAFVNQLVLDMKNRVQVEKLSLCHISCGWLTLYLDRNTGCLENLNYVLQVLLSCPYSRCECHILGHDLDHWVVINRSADGILKDRQEHLCVFLRNLDCRLS